MNTIADEIRELKKEKNAVILAHYYVDDDVQEVADYIGDSYYLSKVATTVPQDTIVFCGVSFMGESAKIMNPDKTVLMPDENADCPMAHMAVVEKIKKIKETTDDVAVVCYINSTAELKMVSDVCVTSSNALKIVKALPNKNILFIPDENLGRYIASLVPEKNFIFNDGFCHVHAGITPEKVNEVKKLHPEAQILAHPECKENVLKLADYIGSTSGIIDYATNSSCKQFIICTETGVFYELQQKNPDKKFYSVNATQVCPNMKKITLKKVLYSLKNNTYSVQVTDEVRTLANKPLHRMLELAK